MLPEVTSADYRGSRNWESLEAALPSAVAAVREVIGFNVPEGEAQVLAYKDAVCAAMDVDAAYGFSGGIAEAGGSLRLGSFSVSQGGGQSSYAMDMDRAIRRALSGSGLLYQGLG